MKYSVMQFPGISKKVGLGKVSDIGMWTEKDKHEGTLQSLYQNIIGNIKG